MRILSHCCSSSMVFLFVHCFFYFKSNPCLNHFVFLLPLLIWAWNFIFPSLSLDSIPYSYYCSSLYPLKIIFLYCSHLLFSFLFLVIFSFLLYLYESLLICCCYWPCYNISSILFLLVHYLFLFYFKPHIILFPFLTLVCCLPSLFYLHFKFYFLPFFALFLFPALTISPLTSLQNNFFLF